MLLNTLRSVPSKRCPVEARAYKAERRQLKVKIPTHNRMGVPWEIAFPKPYTKLDIMLCLDAASVALRCDRTGIKTPCA